MKCKNPECDNEVVPKGEWSKNLKKFCSQLCSKQYHEKRIAKGRIKSVKRQIRSDVFVPCSSKEQKGQGDSIDKRE
jgi:hypothetical protein